MTTDTASERPAATDRGLARGVLVAATPDRVTIAVPGSDYRLDLVPTAPDPTPVGKRTRGRIDAQALRVHGAAAGGQFIEPVYGAPRIVAGVIADLDPAGNRLLVRVPVPMWVRPIEGQTIEGFEIGQAVNFYVRSGTTWTPEPV
ncbi:MAG: hypothetical protein KDA25_08120 [Phycisphaerales bacterium]|nr:hypothetical protein [Phycisphaerales bacterium]